MSDFRQKVNCRICGNEELKSYANLGLLPLANALNNSNTEASRVYPLEVFFCEHCFMSQLGIVVDPTILYNNYPYQSSVSKTFQKHCRKMALEIKSIMRKNEPSLIDIASNDGCLLEQFRDMGYDVRGVEPSENLADLARAKDIPTTTAFWNHKIDLGKVDVITATNVFAHVDDLDDFMAGVIHNLADRGMFVIEVPWLFMLMQRAHFDTIYHEHLSYFLVGPIKKKLAIFGLEIFRVDMTQIHGGSLRIYSGKPGIYKQDSSVEVMQAVEEGCGFHKLSTYRNNFELFKQHKDAFIQAINSLVGKKVVGYGACAKATMLINSCGVNSQSILAIGDDTPSKQGKNLPGCNIPIVASAQMREMNPDVMILFAWNFAPELIENTKDWFKGNYLIQLNGDHKEWRQYSYQEWVASETYSTPLISQNC